MGPLLRSGTERGCVSIDGVTNSQVSNEFQISSSARGPAANTTECIPPESSSHRHLRDGTFPDKWLRQPQRRQGADSAL